MKLVLLCSDPATLKDFLPPNGAPVQFLILQENEQSRAIRAHLEQGGCAVELPKAELYRKRSAVFRLAYVEALGSLNAELGSPEWWAMPFTTKNPISTSLCRDCFEFLLIVDLAKTIGGGLIVVTENARVAAQVTRWGTHEHIQVINKIKFSRAMRQRLEQCAPLSILLLMVRAVWFRLLMGRSIPNMSRQKSDPTLVVTLVHPHSITPQGEFRDTYFGCLSEQLQAWNVPVVIVGQIQGLSRRLAEQFGRKTTVPAIPFDAVLRVKEIIGCGIEALRRWWQSDYDWKESTLTLQGISVTGLLQSAIQHSHSSGDVFRSVYAFESARAIAHLFRPARCFYPYENRAWEKMLLLGIRSVSPRTRLLGYNHASITGSHTNFMLKKEEQTRMPFPDRVITMGRVTHGWLEKQGGHPQQVLTVGCALRQSSAAPAALIKSRRDKKVSRLLVALATSQVEYVNTLVYLQEALASEMVDVCERVTIKIRPHPTIRLENALKVLEGMITFPFEVSSESVARDLDWADVVLYASSTIGLEAVGAGIPAIYMDLGDILNTDPMDGWFEFKWVAGCPTDLVPILSNIQALGDEEFASRQRLGREYAESYLTPVTEECLRIFQDV